MGDSDISECVSCPSLNRRSAHELREQGLKGRKSCWREQRLRSRRMTAPTPSVTYLLSEEGEGVVCVCECECVKERKFVCIIHRERESLCIINCAYVRKRERDVE